MGALLLRQGKGQAVFLLTPASSSTSLSEGFRAGDRCGDPGERDPEDARELNEILARHTDQPLEKIEKDTERDFS